MKWKDVDKN